jgi:hypothetical protein
MTAIKPEANDICFQPSIDNGGAIVEFVEKDDPGNECLRFANFWDRVPIDSPMS